MSSEMGFDQDDFVRGLIVALKNADVLEALSDVVAQRVKNEVVLLRAELRQRSEDITALEKQVTELRNENDRLEQYSRRNSIRITNIPEKQNEDVSETVLQLVNETLALTPPLTISGVDRLHRVGKPAAKTDDKRKPRAILVKFATYRSRKRVMEVKDRLLDEDADPKKAIWFNEDLTKLRSELLYLARAEKKKRNLEGVWTSDGTILAKNKKGVVVALQSKGDLQAAISGCPKTASS
jgi:hypothetical protein